MLPQRPEFSYLPARTATGWAGNNNLALEDGHQECDKVKAFCKRLLPLNCLKP
jgi:hypothetical protein